MWGGEGRRGSRSLSAQLQQLRGLEEEKDGSHGWHSMMALTIYGVSVKSCIRKRGDEIAYIVSMGV